MRDLKQAPVIVIVEDSSTIAKILGQMLKTLGYRVSHFLTADQATVALAQLSAAEQNEICLFISDLMMPGMNGIEFRLWLSSRPEFKNTPFIFHSAMSDPHFIDDALSISSHGYIVKPVSFERLQQKISSIFPRSEAVAKA